MTSSSSSSELPSSSLDMEDPSNCPFWQEKAATPLRITCYGSSSSATPERYLHAARTLGYGLAQRGHTCVNGAGAYGCMAALNEGAARGNGAIVGVIHEMWLSGNGEDALRDGGAHAVFDGTGNSSSALSVSSETRREILVARGRDLQERKRLLVEGADALLVLPGGPGTWDELWEMACARGIGLSSLPIVCVNCDGYYDPFREMLERAYREQLTKCRPHELVHFCEAPEEAVRWVEAYCAAAERHHHAKKTPHASLTSALLRKSSLLHVPATNGRGNGMVEDRWWTVLLYVAVGFVAGAVVGATASGRQRR